MLPPARMRTFGRLLLFCRRAPFGAANRRPMPVRAQARRGLPAIAPIGRCSVPAMHLILRAIAPKSIGFGYRQSVSELRAPFGYAIRRARRSRCCAGHHCPIERMCLWRFRDRARRRATLPPEVAMPAAVPYRSEFCLGRPNDRQRARSQMQTLVGALLRFVSEFARRADLPHRAMRTYFEHGRRPLHSSAPAPWFAHEKHAPIRFGAALRFAVRRRRPLGNPRPALRSLFRRSPVADDRRHEVCLKAGGPRRFPESPPPGFLLRRRGAHSLFAIAPFRVRRVRDPISGAKSVPHTKAISPHWAICAAIRSDVSQGADRVASDRCPAAGGCVWIDLKCFLLCRFLSFCASWYTSQVV